MCLTRPSAVRGFHSPPDDACSSGTARGDVADEQKPQSARKLAACRLLRQGRVESNGQLPRHGQLARLHSFGLTKCGASAALAATRPSPPLPARCPPRTTHTTPRTKKQTRARAPPLGIPTMWLILSAHSQPPPPTKRRSAARRPSKARRAEPPCALERPGPHHRAKPRADAPAASRPTSRRAQRAREHRGRRPTNVDRFEVPEF